MPYPHEEGAALATTDQTLSDTTRLRLFAAIVLLVVLGLAGIAIHKPSGRGTNTAASTSTSSTSSSSSTQATAGTVPSSTAAPATTSSSAAVTTSTTVAPAGTGGSGLGSSGSGDVASGRSPTPQTGGGGWLVIPGLACLALAWGARRLARAAA